MSKQGELYRFINWLNKELKPVEFGEIVILSVSQSEYFKQYSIGVNGRNFNGNEEVVKDKLISFVITELVNKIK